MDPERDNCRIHGKLSVKWQFCSLLSRLWMAGSPQPSWLLSCSSVLSQPWCMSLWCYCTHSTVMTLVVPLFPLRWITSLHVSRNRHNTRPMGRVCREMNPQKARLFDSSERHLNAKAQKSPVLRFWLHLSFPSCLAFPCHIPLCVTKCPLPVVVHFPSPEGPGSETGLSSLHLLRFTSL